MTAYCFFDVQEVTDPEALNEYRSKVCTTVEHHGGRYVLVGGELEAVEGDWRPTFPCSLSSQAWARAALVRFRRVPRAERAAPLGNEGACCLYGGPARGVCRERRSVAALAGALVCAIGDASGGAFSISIVHVHVPHEGHGQADSRSDGLSRQSRDQR
jgi:uncharacterized protein (DUF1330 family)